MARPVKKVIEPIQLPFERLAARLVEGEAQEGFIKFPREYPRSPLMYLGRKNRAVKAIYSVIPESERKLCSPFLGGAFVELACSTRMEVFGYDIFEPLIAFWQELLENPHRLAERVRSYYPLSRSQFYNLKKRYANLENKTERAAAFYVVNRFSFSGRTLSSGMPLGQSRFAESAIQRLETFHAENFNVEQADFSYTIPKHEDAFLYLAPPYMNGQAPYGVKGYTHKGFDHKALAELLYGRDRWIMSYNDCEEIRTLYKDHMILSVEWVYGMSKDETSKEVLVLSKDLENVTITK